MLGRMKKISIIYLAVAVMVVFLPGTARKNLYGQTQMPSSRTPLPEECRTLSLEECRSLAVESNKERAIARETSRKADFTVRSYKANYLPKISASGMYLYSNGKMEQTLAGGYLPTFVPGPDGTLQPNVLTGPDGRPVTDNNGQTVFKEYAYFPGVPLKFQTEHVFSAMAQVEQPVYMGGKITAAYNLAKLGRELSGLNENLAVSDVILQSDQAYWNCVRAKEMMTSVSKYVETVEEFFRNVNNAAEVGMKSKNDVLKVQVQLNRARLDLLRVRNALRLAKMNLCYVTGLPLDSNVDVTDDLEEVSAKELPENYDVADRPEYRMLTARIEQKGEEVKLTRSDFLPNVGIMASYGYMNGLKFNGSKLLDKASFLGVLSVNIPIFHWGEGRNKIRAAKSDQQIIALQREDVRQKMELEIEQAYNAFTEAQMEVSLTEQSLEQARENLSESGDRYETGLETIADHLQAQAQWQKAWADLIDARADLRLSRTRYLKAIGQL